MIIERYPEIATLPSAEKRQLAEELLTEADLADDQDPNFEEYPMHPWLVEILEERLREADANPDAGVPMEEAFAQLRAELGLRKEVPSTS